MTTASAPALTELTGTYTLDPAHTRIGFVARHAMVTKVRGAFNEFAGTAELDDAVEPRGLSDRDPEPLGHLLRRRRRQKRTDNREAQPRPTLMHPRSASLRHVRPPKHRRADAKRPRRGAATRILCGSLAPVRKRALPIGRRSAARGSAARR